MISIMTPDHSARMLACLIANRKSFFFVRIGDGAIECLKGSGRMGHTCDGEVYTEELADQLSEAIGILRQSDGLVIWGDWRTATGGSTPTYVADWEILVDPANRVLVNYEALLLMRESPALEDFYNVVRDDPREKVYIGRDAKQASQLLNCTYSVTTPMGHNIDVGWLLDSIERTKAEVVLFGAGMGGLVAVVKYWSLHSNATCIHLGSALDPLFHSATRAGQLPQCRARRLMERGSKEEAV